jgi:DNA-binding NarL/FixJ family response regulator
VGKAREQTAELTDGQRLRVLVVDDDPLVRRSIRDVLRPAGMLVVGEAEDGRDAVRAARYYKPDIILLDVMMPGVDGITALEQLVADPVIEAKIVILSVRGEHDLGYLALRMGAIGFLNKDLELAVLPRVLQDVSEGAAALSREFTADLARRLRDVPEGDIGTRPVQSILTTREWEIVDQLCLGQSTEAIADTFVLSAETVRTHIKNIMRKLNVHSRADVVDLVKRLRAGDLVARAALSRPPGPARVPVP